MYQYPQQVYQHNPYQECQLDLNESLKHNVNIKHDSQIHIQVAQPQYSGPIVTENVITDVHLKNESNKVGVDEQGKMNGNKKKKRCKKNIDESKSADGLKEDKNGKKVKKQSVDTSTFSVEERLVAAVWVHERSHTNTTISEIKHNFKRRFGREPPSKTTLFAWERKLFSTGNVCDAPRTGRPINRKCHLSEVAASIRAAPSLSLRARALALQVPRTTLHNILRKDLSYTAVKDKIDKARSAVSAAEKQQSKRRIKQNSVKTESVPVEGVPYPAAPPPAPPPPPTHMQYVVTHTMQTHSHAYS